MSQDINWEHGELKFCANRIKLEDTLARRKLDFKDAAHAFTKSHLIEFDEKHSLVEARYLLSGFGLDGRSVKIGYTERSDQIRIHTARYMEPWETRIFIAQLSAQDLKDRSIEKQLWRRRKSIERRKELKKYREPE